ncbi:amyloid fiber anchoring/assembly protein TapA [Rossellomorea marisflavi]|uniref:amyloid fiber anchoring/assembly protein TapA n=1 Tax=Rossellomorea marisflavi TaxID=189381 RepID=UPI003459B918
MITIRSLRAKKFKSSRKRRIIVLQLFAIWYSVAIIASSIQGETGAYFNDQDQVTGTITAGTWEAEESWDKSSLKFTNTKDQTIKACPPKEISTRIKNTGELMKGTTEFEVYFILKGNPKKGQKVHEGKIPAIAKNQTIDLKYTAREAGTYKFRALQRPGHGNKTEGRQELWSESIIIDCVKPKAEEKGKAVEEKAPALEKEQPKPAPPQTEEKPEKEAPPTPVEPEEKAKEKEEPKVEPREEPKAEAPPEEPKPEEAAPAAQNHSEPAAQSQPLDKQDTKSEDE